MTSVPHFDLPFRFVGNTVATAEQDTLEDITNCVEAVLRTPQGARVDAVGFGRPDPTFELQPIPLQPLIQVLLDQEPRASVLMTQSPDQFSSIVANVVAQVSAQEVTSG